MTYNISDGGAGRQDLILEVLEQSQADVILLQEIFSESTVHKFSSKLGMAYFVAEGNSRRNLAIMARYRVVAHNSFHPFPLRNTLLEVSLEYLPGQELYIFGLHLAPSYHFLAEFWRLWEVKVILQRICGLKPNQFVMAGDFNAVAPNDPIDLESFPVNLKLLLWSQGGVIMRKAITELQVAGIIDSYRLLHPYDTGYTLPALEPHVRLDYIFVNRTLQNAVHACEVVTGPSSTRKASDHLPLLLELKLS